MNLGSGQGNRPLQAAFGRCGETWARCFLVVVQPSKTQTRKGYKYGYYSRPVRASFSSRAPEFGFLGSLYIGQNSLSRTAKGSNPSLVTLALYVDGGHLLLPPPGARRGRAHQAFAHSSFSYLDRATIPCAGVGIGRRIPQPPVGAMGRAGCCGTRLGVLRGWMDYTAEGAIRPRPPDSQIRLAG